MNTLVFLSSGFFLPFFLFYSTLANASCVDTDVNLQIAIRSSQSPSAQQQNKSDSAIDDNCFGNTVTTTNGQIYFGTGSVNQNRNRSATQGDSNNPLSPLEIDSPNSVNHFNIQKDIPLNSIPYNNQ